ncbi:MAG TPA: hypothetical protein VFO27_00025 [Bryobacteraceae bacterium]|nr:hypothetical protein [Bryobacteraceae bacterium]
MTTTITRDELVRLPSRKLDALVAETVMGLVRCTAQHSRPDEPCHALPESPDCGAETQRYSTDVGIAWTVVDCMRGRDNNFLLMVAIDGTATASFFHGPDQSKAPSTCFDAARSICEAAVSAVLGV